VWRLPSSLAVALAVVLAFVACAPASSTIQRTASPSVIVVPTVLANGRVELVIQPRYALGQPTRIDVAIVATRGTITGPTQARVMASGINEGGAPAEVLVRRLDATAATSTADQRATTIVTWNGEDEFGVRVPADAYVLLLDFESKDGEITRTIRATATLQMND
jgi:hypothetical protein